MIDDDLILRAMEAVDRHLGGPRARDSYEDSAVRFACKCLGRPDWPARIIALAAERADTREFGGGCSFTVFDEIACLPVCLRIGRLREMRFLAIPDLYNNFKRTPIAQALSLLADEYDPDERYLGLVFRWAGAPDESGRQATIKGGKFMVAHTAPIVGVRAGSRIVAPLSLAGTTRMVTVEHLAGLLVDYAGDDPGNVDLE